MANTSVQVGSRGDIEDDNVVKFYFYFITILVSKRLWYKRQVLEIVSRLWWEYQKESGLHSPTLLTRPSVVMCTWHIQLSEHKT